MNECNVVSWVGSWDRQRTLGENQASLKRVWVSVTIIVSMLVHYLGQRTIWVLDVNNGGNGVMGIPFYLCDFPIKLKLRQIKILQF